MQKYGLRMIWTYLKDTPVTKMYFGVVIWLALVLLVVISGFSRRWDKGAVASGASRLRIRKQRVPAQVRAFEIVFRVNAAFGSRHVGHADRKAMRQRA